MVLFLEFDDNNTFEKAAIFKSKIGLLRRIYGLYKKSAKEFCSLPIRVVGPNNTLYVSQREIAVIEGNSSTVSILGTEDASTCNMVVIRDELTRRTLLTHLDGYKSVTHIVQIMQKLHCETFSPGHSRLKLSLVGGFLDDRKRSEKLVKELLFLFNDCDAEFELHLACVCLLNNEEEENVNSSIVCGIGVDTATGEIFPATFQDHGPCVPLRNLRALTTNFELMDIYDSATNKLTIAPFDYFSSANASFFLKKRDSYMRRHLSSASSPFVEPDLTVSKIKQSLQFAVDNPDPSEYFSKNVLQYSMNENGLWS